MSTKRIILISGYARSGKDTLANALVKELEAQGQKAEVFKFADSLKGSLQTAVQAVGLKDVNVWTENTEQKMSLRPLLVEFGRFARSQDVNVFVDHTLRQIHNRLIRELDVAVISDCRYLNECQLVRNYGASNGIRVHRLHIDRSGQGPANDEEEQSIDLLNREDTLLRTWKAAFNEGDVEVITRWAEILLRPTDGVSSVIKIDSVQIKHLGPDFQSGTERFGTEAIERRNEQRVEDMKAMNAVLQDADTLLTVINRVDWFEDKLDRLQQIIGKMGERVDDISDRLANQYNADEKLFQKANDADEQLLGLKLTLERIDARLKRLEVARG